MLCCALFFIKKTLIFFRVNLRYVLMIKENNYSWKSPYQAILSHDGQEQPSSVARVAEALKDDT
jgi:hypothetical protein